MAMNPGDATAASGTMAKAIFDEMESLMGASDSTENATKRKAICAAIARGVCAHLAANAKAKVTTSTAALQRTPNPNNADTATQAPAAQVLLAIE